jgi:hypothetical protein
VEGVKGRGATVVGTFSLYLSLSLSLHSFSCCLGNLIPILDLLLAKVGSSPAKPRLTRRAPHTTSSCMLAASVDRRERGTSSTRRSRSKAAPDTSPTMAAADTDDVPHFSVSSQRDLPTGWDIVRCPFSVDIPASEDVLLGGIEPGAFDGCRGLTTIYLPECCTAIGNHAFAGCSGLTSLDLPEGCTEIGNHALAGCRGLTSFELPEG